MQLVFPIRRYYLQRTGISGEVCKIATKFGDYRYFSAERTICDCARMKNKLDSRIYQEITDTYERQKFQKDRVYAYAKELRALKNVENLWV